LLETKLKGVPSMNRLIPTLPILCVWFSACGMDQDVLSFSQETQDVPAAASGGATSRGPSNAGQGGVENPYEKGGYGGNASSPNMKSDLSYAFDIVENGVKAHL